MPEQEVVPAGTSQVVVTGTPVNDGAPTAQGKALTERMNALDEIKAGASNTLGDRLADSDLGYYDDNLANKRYITKLDPAALQTSIGTPAGQLNRLRWPTDDDARLGALEGVLVLREDGSFFSIPAGIKSLAEVIDPVNQEPLVGKIDPKRASARKEAAAGTGDVDLKTNKTKSTVTAPKHLAAVEKGNKKGKK